MFVPHPNPSPHQESVCGVPTSSVLAILRIWQVEAKIKMKQIKTVLKRCRVQQRNQCKMTKIRNEAMDIGNYVEMLALICV